MTGQEKAALLARPKRVQRRRSKGWTMPEGTVYVGRPTAWGNPWKVGSTGWTIKPGGVIDRDPHPPLTVEQAVESFRNDVEWQMRDEDYAASLRYALAGRDLACWCPLDQPCHADVLLAVANAQGESDV